jgi:hypothetical protein
MSYLSISCKIYHPQQSVEDPILSLISEVIFYRYLQQAIYQLDQPHEDLLAKQLFLSHQLHG